VVHPGGNPVLLVPVAQARRCGGCGKRKAVSVWRQEGRRHVMWCCCTEEDLLPVGGGTGGRWLCGTYACGRRNFGVYGVPCPR